MKRNYVDIERKKGEEGRVKTVVLIFSDLLYSFISPKRCDEKSAVLPYLQFGADQLHFITTWGKLRQGFDILIAFE